MKKLFIRFFERASDQIPRDSQSVCVENCTPHEILISLEETNLLVRKWMTENQGGKVDFVWL